MTETQPTIDDCTQWLEKDDTRSRVYRARRLQFLVNEYGSDDDYQVLFGGPETFWAFQEARLAYLNGLYLASILLSQTFLEHLIGGLLALEPDDRPARPKYRELLNHALKRGYITNDEFCLFDKLRSIRNLYGHSRRPEDPDWIVRRAIRESSHPDDVLAEDAKSAIRAILRLSQRHPFLVPNSGEP